jgi:hypothetical protein
METPDLYKLVEILRSQNKKDSEIIEILVGMIKQHVQAGGSLIDIINYEYLKARSKD